MHDYAQSVSQTQSKAFRHDSTILFLYLFFSLRSFLPFSLRLLQAPFLNDQRRKAEQGIFLFSELSSFISGRCLFVAVTSCGRGDCMSLLKGFGVKLIYNIGVTITVRDYRQICIAIEIIEIVITQIAIMQIILEMLSL